MRGGIIILEGQNITLKGLEYHQLPILKEWMNDFEIAIKLLRIEPSITYFTEKWYNSFQDDRTKLIFSINDRLSDKFIGCIGVNNIEFIDKKGEIYIYIGDRSYWNRGYASEALKIIMDYLFNYYNLNKLYLNVRADNQNAIKLYNKVGFKIEGKFRNDKFIEGKYIDIIRMAILKDDYI